MLFKQPVSTTSDTPQDLAAAARAHALDLSQAAKSGPTIKTVKTSKMTIKASTASKLKRSSTGKTVNTSKVKCSSTSIKLAKTKTKTSIKVNNKHKRAKS